MVVGCDHRFCYCIMHDVDSGTLSLTLSDGSWICGYVEFDTEKTLIYSHRLCDESGLGLQHCASTACVSWTMA